LAGGTHIATNEDDIAVDLESTTDGKRVVVAGTTLGELDGNGNNKKGTNNYDAFISVFDNDSQQAVPSLSRHTQFGTIGDDQIIDIERVNDKKFMVLWSEDQTDNGETVYRISPFSFDGVKLTADP